MSELSLQPCADGDFAWLMGEGPPTRPFAVAPDLSPTPVLAIVRGLARSWMIIRDGEIVGLISLLRQPSGGSAEIGYGVAASRRGRGNATAAVEALLSILTGEGLQTATAESSVENPASQRVLERNDFERTGRRDDPEDGWVDQWQRSLKD